MRIVGTIANEHHAQRLSSYLKRNGINNSCEMTFDPSSSNMSYPLWVHDGDQIDMARVIFERFEKNPADPEFDTHTIEPAQIEVPLEKKVSKQVPLRTPITTFFLALCSFIFFWNFVQELAFFREGIPEESFLMTPIQDQLLYDVPPALEELEKVVEKYSIGPDQKVEELPPEIKAELHNIEKIPFWRGFYDWVLLKVKGKDTSVAEGPMFIKIREGEVWRLFTPCLLHQNFLHILFNMIWLWALGRPIEQRIGGFRTLVLTVFVGVISNTVQYLMSGPFFLGYSGIIMGLAGFIWIREKLAPWEGYPLHRSTLLFLVFFVLAMFALQLGSFLVLIFTSIHFAPNIANSAHIAGALTGLLLGRLPLFAWKAEKKS